MKNETITEALGINETFFKFAHDIVDEVWENEQRVSDIINKTAEEVRNYDLGEIDAKISDYEKKLILLGMIIGGKRARMELSDTLMGGLISHIKKMKGDE